MTFRSTTAEAVEILAAQTQVFHDVHVAPAPVIPWEADDGLLVCTEPT